MKYWSYIKNNNNFQLQLLEIPGNRLLQGKQKLHVFPLTLPILISCVYPKVFIAIFEQALLKSECVPCRN
jgi:hypothetical protein